MRRDVRGRVVLITGASRGIGKRLADRLAAKGARLALASRSAGELAALAAKLKTAGTDVEAFPTDLTDPAGRESLVRGVVGRFGGLDVLVNCAGVCSFGEFATSWEDINRRVLEINFFAPAGQVDHPRDAAHQ
jgi:short-subunit dehydrogenase